MMWRMWTAVGCLMLVSACSPAPESPVVVYVPTEFEEEAREWLPQSGLAVTVIAGDSTANTELVVTKRDSPRADVLLTSGVVDIWRAAEEGALRPIAGEPLRSVPESLKDPDGMWAAVASRFVTIGTAPGLDIMHIIDLRKLAAPELKAQVCLSSSDLPDNRALVAMLIAEMGNRPAERLVRGWVRNLAEPPFASADQLFDALQSGDCRYGILPSDVGVVGMDRVELPTRYYNIQGIGVARHAQYPESGQQLVDWMLSQRQLEDVPASKNPNVGQAGWYDQEARLLVERAGYR